MQRFRATDGHRKCTVFLFDLSSHYHIYIFKSLCASKDDYFENLGETNVLACKMFTSGCRPWLKNVACLRRQLQRKRHTKTELCVKLSILRLFRVDHVVQNRRSALSLAWHERFSCKGKDLRIYCCDLALTSEPKI